MEGSDLLLFFAEPGLEVSHCRYFQDRYIHRLIRYQSLELGIFFLNSLQLLDHVRTHTALLLAPAIISLLTDFQLLTNFRDILALPNYHICLS